MCVRSRKRDLNLWQKSILLLCIFIWFYILFLVILTNFLNIDRTNRIYQQKNVTDDDQLCLTPYCMRAAKDLLESMNKTVEPCENFYEFTCGKWLQQTKIPDHERHQDTFQMVRNELDNTLINLLSPLSLNETIESKAITNVRRLYASCMNETSIEMNSISTLLSFINTELGGWPVLLGSTWNHSTFNFSRLLLKLHEHNQNIFFNIKTNTDLINSSIYCIQIGQSDLGLEHRNYYIEENKVNKAYQQFMRNIALELTNLTSMIDEDIIDIFDFETKLAKHHWTLDERRARLFESVHTTLGNLSRTINTNFDFTDYLRHLYAVSNISLIDTDIVLVTEADFVRNASLIISQQSPRALQNYAVWRFIMGQLDNMPKKYRIIKQEFIRIFREITTEEPRTITCATYANENMGFVVSKLYIDKYTDKNARSEVIDMMNNIRHVFEDMLERSIWMDPVSKRRAIEKVRAINAKIGYPDYLDSDNITKLEQDYAEYNFDSSYLQNTLLVDKLKAKNNHQLLHNTVDRKAWTDAVPTTINAFYSALNNDITFPAGILQPPFFHKDAPRYLNYAGVGVLMGHETTHGFDDLGRHFDKDGNKISWWSNQTINAFNKHKQCIIDQYSNYTMSQINLQLNGELTQGENIAENGALKEAFFAYQKWTQSHKNMDKKLVGFTQYSVEQMFFIYYGRMWCSKMTDKFATNIVLGDPHSPDQFRVLGSTSNFAEFDRVFGCKPGQNNSRVNKCTVW